MRELLVFVAILAVVAGVVVYVMHDRPFRGNEMDIFVLNGAIEFIEDFAKAENRPLTPEEEQQIADYRYRLYLVEHGED